MKNLSKLSLVRDSTDNDVRVSLACQEADDILGNGHGRNYSEANASYRN